MKYLICDTLKPYIFTLQWNEFVSLGRKLNFYVLVVALTFFGFLFPFPDSFR